MWASRLHTLALLSAIFLVAAQAHGTPRFSSRYTDLTQCPRMMPRNLPSGGAPDGADSPIRCRGPGIYEVTETYSAESTLRRVEAPTHSFSRDLLPIKAKCHVIEYGEKLEWRLANGVAFAVITRAWCYGEDPDAQGQQGQYPNRKNVVGRYLLVRGLLGHATLGADIDVAEHSGESNRRAQELADQAFAGTRQDGTLNPQQ